MAALNPVPRRVDEAPVSDGSPYIYFLCRHCGCHLAVRQDRAGKTLHCKHCRCAVRVPNASTCERPRPAPAPTSGEDPSAETVFGEPVVFEVRGGRRIFDTPIVPIERSDVALPAPTPLHRFAAPLRASAMVAGFILVAMLLIIHSTTPPKRSMAAPPATAPATTRPR